jgi:ergothioneine biosynthesis protein EgtB
MNNGAPPTALGEARSAWASRWRSVRARSHAFFEDVLAPSAYGERPIALRHPFVFYEGHLAAFAVNVVVKRALGREGIDPALEALFARGIDPPDEAGVPRFAWPRREAVRAYVERADAAVRDALETAPEGALDEAAPLVFEHEEMHQETLLYMLHRLPASAKRRPRGTPPPETAAAPPARRSVRIEAGRATLGARRGGRGFGWDNEFEECEVAVGEFEIDAHAVTNADFLEFVADRGYSRAEFWAEDAWGWRQESRTAHPAFWVFRDGAWFWRGQFEDVPLPPAWPVWVSHAEARAYAAWRGRRLPTEAEFHRAAFSRPDGGESEHPWGRAAPSAAHGNFGFGRWDPVPCGARPAGASARGVHDLVGNGWEWTSTPFAPLPGFSAMPLYPGYSADFFDGRHFVLKGASPATAEPLLRRSFRNWFQPHYPFVYAKFRTAGA